MHIASQPAHSQARAVDQISAGFIHRLGSAVSARFMKFDKRQIFRNVGSTWFALGLNVVVGIFLSPYILHRLGDDAFGLWILIFSVTGYYGLFDLGIRSSIVRYVARFSATDDHAELNRLVNTAMFGYSAIGILALGITLVATYYVHSIFPKIPVEFVPTARWLLLIVGTSVSAGFPIGVFSGILEGLQRFHLLNLNSACTTLMRALLIVIALTHGYGLLTLALITTSLPLLGGLVNAAVVFRLRATALRIPICEPGQLPHDCELQRHNVRDHIGRTPAL